jgi:hypothetical protein
MLIIPFVIIPAKAIAKTMTRKVKTSGACRSSANQLPIVTRTQKGETEQEKGGQVQSCSISPDDSGVHVTTQVVTERFIITGPH